MRGERPARGERPPRPERGEHSGRPERGERPARSERPARPERGERREWVPPRAAQPGERPARKERKRAPKPDKGVVWVPGPNAREIKVEAGRDLAHFLVHSANGKVSVRAARRLLENGCCRIDGRVETYGSRILKRGEIVEFFLPEDTEHHFDPRRVLLDDVGVIAYDKPPFLPVTPTDSVKSWSLLDILTPHLGELFPVHRLDADTSGIVLFARSKEVAERLETLFKEHGVQKTYHAIVRGHPRESGTYRSYLVKVESQRGFEKWKSGRGADAREAITTWTVERRLGKYGSLLRVEPKTGRYHQIRIHFSEMGFPLYGERLYSDRRDPVHVTRHLLHASRVQLPHPVGGPSLDISCPPPHDFIVAIEQLEKL